MPYMGLPNVDIEHHSSPSSRGKSAESTEIAKQLMAKGVDASLALEVNIPLTNGGDLIQFKDVNQWKLPSMPELDYLRRRVHDDWMVPFKLKQQDIVRASGLGAPYVCYLLKDPSSPNMNRRRRIEVFSVLMELFRQFDDGVVTEHDFMRVRDERTAGRWQNAGSRGPATPSRRSEDSDPLKRRRFGEFGERDGMDDGVEGATDEMVMFSGGLHPRHMARATTDPMTGRSNWMADNQAAMMGAAYGMGGFMHPGFPQPMGGYAMSPYGPQGGMMMQAAAMAGKSVLPLMNYVQLTQQAWRSALPTGSSNHDVYKLRHENMTVDGPLPLAELMKSRLTAALSRQKKEEETRSGLDELPEMSSRSPRSVKPEKSSIDFEVEKKLSSLSSRVADLPMGSVLSNLRNVDLFRFLISSDAVLVPIGVKLDNKNRTRQRDNWKPALPLGVEQLWDLERLRKDGDARNWLGTDESGRSRWEGCLWLLWDARNTNSTMLDIVFECLKRDYKLDDAELSEVSNSFLSQFVCYRDIEFGFRALVQHLKDSLGDKFNEDDLIKTVDINCELVEEGVRVRDTFVWNLQATDWDLACLLTNFVVDYRVPSSAISSLFIDLKHSILRYRKNWITQKLESMYAGNPDSLSSVQLWNVKNSDDLFNRQTTATSRMPLSVRSARDMSMMMTNPNLIHDQTVVESVAFDQRRPIDNQEDARISEDNDPTGNRYSLRRSQEGGARARSSAMDGQLAKRPTGLDDEESEADTDSSVDDEDEVLGVKDMVDDDEDDEDDENDDEEEDDPDDVDYAKYVPRGTRTRRKN